MLLEYLEWHDLGCQFMGAGQNNWCSDAVHVGPQPVGRGHAPAIAWFEPRKAKLWRWSHQVVSNRCLMLKKFSGGDSADGVATKVGWVGIAATVAIPTGHWFGSAHFEWFTEDVAGGCFSHVRESRAFARA